MQDLTRRQKDVFGFITSCIDERGYAPTLREIGQSLGIRSTNGVHEHLMALERKGYLVREGTKARTIRLVNRMGRNLCLPLLGPLTPGKDPLSEDNIWERLSVDRLLIGAGRDHFVVRVGEDCPPSEGLSHGDYLFVRSGGSVTGGDLMVLQEGEKMSLKRKKKTIMRLGSTHEESGDHGSDFGDRANREPSTNGGRGGRVMGVVVGYFRKM